MTGHSYSLTVTVSARIEGPMVHHHKKTFVCIEIVVENPKAVFSTLARDSLMLLPQGNSRFIVATKSINGSTCFMVN